MIGPHHTRILDFLTGKPVAAKSPKKKAKAKPHERTIKLCVLVRKLETDQKESDVGAQFLSQCKKHRRFDWSQVPTGFAWLAVSPEEQVYFIFYWNKSNAHTLPMFDEFCQKSGRAYGVLDVDYKCRVAEDEFSFLDCRLIHEDEYLKNVSRFDQRIPEEKLVETAHRLLKLKKKQQEIVQEHVFLSDTESHDKKLKAQIQATFIKNSKSMQEKLNQEFGLPSEVGTSVHPLIPCNGVFDYALWETTKKRLYLAAIHEETELPIQLILGTCYTAHG